MKRFGIQGGDAISGPYRRAAGIAGVCATLVLLAGCRLEMHDQPRHEPFEASSFFEDGMAARPPLPGTVPRGQLRTNAASFEGLNGTNLVENIPAALTLEFLERGRERFNIHCSVCHGLTGDGDGMIAQRGYPRPPSFHDDRLRSAPAGHLYRVITHGYGVMFPYAPRVTPDDRWAIVGYIRALQLSQYTEVEALSAQARAQLRETNP